MDTKAEIAADVAAAPSILREIRAAIKLAHINDVGSPMVVFSSPYGAAMDIEVGGRLFWVIVGPESVPGQSIIENHVKSSNSNQSRFENVKLFVSICCKGMIDHDVVDQLYAETAGFSVKNLADYVYNRCYELGIGFHPEKGWKNK